MTAPPAMAQSIAVPRAFDGLWSVYVDVLRGNCAANSSFPVRVVRGAIAYAGQVNIDVSGTIGRDGRVTARVSRGAETLSISGRVSAARGAGVWTASSRGCSGRWVARRAG
ncbi:hypothetical protein BV133_2299 [Blastochloris viridis]|uniref:Uncharacterized protein n=1 Tax=Blastochloris viridis TaxID=1079 RepID=A0A182D564_BLAVI|nr:hypothetical protein BV133_2299 [Blastochloris viridis]